MTGVGETGAVEATAGAPLTAGELVDGDGDGDEAGGAIVVVGAASAVVGVDTLTLVAAGSDSSTNRLSFTIKRSPTSSADLLMVSSCARASSVTLNSSMDFASLPLGSRILLKLIICSRVPVADMGADEQPVPVLSTPADGTWPSAVASMQPARQTNTATSFMIGRCVRFANVAIAINLCADLNVTLAVCCG